MYVDREADSHICFYLSHFMYLFILFIQGFGGKARRKETTGKTKAQVGRWDQN
jgi:hypothetical protein